MNLYVPPGAVATQVWSATTRSLTNLGAATDASVGATSLAANATLDMRVTAGHFEMITIGVKSNAAATLGVDLGVWDGTVQCVTTSCPSSGGTATMTGYADNVTGLYLKNKDGAQAAQYLGTIIGYTL